ncbi:MAG: ferrous iron transport protein B [Lachnospiraceae bacterium]|nr:ferrous iron transport protein B [Lachnospiraceae bacterium]
MIDGKKVLALLGQPNSGKSTLFNSLTGLKQHVGNWPGKTVEKREGSFIRNGEEIIASDLPGSYSLSANSDEEMITRDYIASGKADAVCILADSSQLERSLFMLADYAGIKVPCFLVLNLADVAKDQGKEINIKALAEKLSIPVCLLSAPDSKNYESFYKCLDEAFEKKTLLDSAALEKAYEAIEGYSELKSIIPDDAIKGYSSAWLSAKVIEGDKAACEKIIPLLKPESKRKYEAVVAKIQKGSVLTGQCKFAWIDDLLSGVVNKVQKKAEFTKFDKAITHKIWGKPLVILIVIGGLLASFIPALPFMGIGMGISALISPLQNALLGAGAHPIVAGIICNVVIQSVAYIVQMLGFVFGVTFVFGLLEEVGIMARVSYVFDNTMARFGLQGKSVMPCLVSFGCTMGGAAGARVIDNWGQKVLTIAIAWAVPCGAAWSIIPMLASNFFGAGAVIIIVAILLIMILHMFVTANIFGRILVKKEDRYGMIMELPPYHKPKVGALLRYVLGRTKDTFLRVMKVIIPICLIFWLLSYTATGLPENTILYKIGSFIEPVTKVFGLNWKLFTAFIASSVGKEGAVGVLSALYANTGTIYGAVVGTNAANDIQTLLAVIPKPEALAFMFAITFNVPCIVALAATYQETHSAKWTAIISVYYTIFALILAFIAYHIGLLIWPV